MTGLIAVFKVVFGFLGICLIGGIFFYTIFDLKPWRRDSQLWNSETDIGAMFDRSKKVKIVKRRSNLNFFIFHISNLIMQKIRNSVLKRLVKNQNFIRKYLGEIYKN